MELKLDRLRTEGADRVQTEVYEKVKSKVDFLLCVEGENGTRLDSRFWCVCVHNLSFSSMPSPQLVIQILLLLNTK